MNRRNELAHVWAHAQKPTGKAGNVSFRTDGDNSLFISYSTPIANRIRRHPCPQYPVFLVSTSRWSTTTASHQYAVRSAVYGPHQFFSESREVTSPEKFAADTIRLAIEYAASARQAAVTHPRRVKGNAEIMGKALDHYETAKKLSELFSLPFDASNVDDLACMKAESDARHEAEEKEHKARDHARRIENLARWRVFDPDTSRTSLPQDGKTYFRLGGQLESSKGVNIPVPEARAALAFILSKRETGWHRNGDTYQVQGFHIDTINQNGIVAGCHRFDWQEVETVRAMLQA